MQLRAWGATDVGKTRDHNEDSFLCDPEHKLFMVCDGMGGHAAGEVASSMAVQIIRNTLVDNWDIIENYIAGKLPKTDVTRILEHAVQEACSEIHERAQGEAEKRGMGTTVDLLLVAGVRGFIAHVGDSRVYLVRQGQVHQLTEDHSVINYLIAKGKLKRSEVDSSPYAKYKNAVTRAVGVYPNVEVDGIDFEVLPGDKFLLCSDGLSFYLDEKNILGTLDTEDLQAATSEFIDRANDGGGHDNITAVVVDILTEADSEHAERARDLHLRMDVLRQMPLFRHLEYKELVRVLNIAKSRTYAPGDVIIQEGEAGDEMFVVLDGTVNLTKEGTHIVDFSRGDHFGEMALVDRAPRSATATAQDQVRMLVIHRKDFFQILRKEPKIAVKLLWSFVRVLTDRLRTTTENLSGAKLAVEAEDLSDEAVALFEESQPPPLNPWASRGSMPAIDIVEPEPIPAKDSEPKPPALPTKKEPASPEDDDSGDDEVGDTLIETMAPNLDDIAKERHRKNPALMDTLPDQVSELTEADLADAGVQGAQMSQPKEESQPSPKSQAGPATVPTKEQREQAQGDRQQVLSHEADPPGDKGSSDSK